MNGPAHFRAAEEQLRLAERAEDSYTNAEHLMAAQVHALLAQVAMTYDATVARETDDIPNRVEWQEALR